MSITVLATEETEGTTIRMELKGRGVAVELLREVRRVGTTTDLTGAYAELYRYVRLVNGQTVWLIEVEFWVPPDAQIWRTWLVDGEPTDAQIDVIVHSNVQAGSVL